MSEPPNLNQASSPSPLAPVAVFEFEFNEAFFIEMFDRYRRTTGSPRLMLVLRVAFTPLLLGCAVLAAVKGRPVIALYVGVFGLVLLFSSKLDEWLLRRGFRKSPFRNEPMRVELADEGLHAAGNVSSASLKWPAFTCVRRFPDGFLLFHGPRLFRWLPMCYLKSGSVEEIDKLLRAKISDYRNA